MTLPRRKPADTTTGAIRVAADTLHKVFGYETFRPGQEEIVAAVLAGEDVFAVMPTGSGKSLCYQLPAIVDGGLTLVVSPLIALMRDQVEQMRSLGVAAAALNSTTGDEAWELIEADALRLLYVSPERLASGAFAARLRRAGVRRLAIDEAHCISQWGHDFRPEYRLLAQARETLGGVPVVALTATADRATRADIAAQLFPEPPRSFVHSFDRPNIDLRFAPKDQPRRQIEDFVADHRGDSGIVYASSRDRAERLAEHLSRKGFRALPYHAGLDPEVRSDHQDIFLREDGVVVCATVAFGMGVNKPDVRFVVHADMPVSVEGYYQEIGRAGRDGLPAFTLTLYGVDDMMLRRRQIAGKAITPEQRRIEENRLGAMIALCESSLCRRQSLLAYFGEESEPCGACDLCRDSAATYDATIDAQKVLSAVVRTGERFGANHIADLLVGEATPNLRRHGHDGLKTFGVGRDRPKRSWVAVTRQLFAAGALAEASAEHGGFRLTEEGAEILRGRKAIALRKIDDTKPERRRRGSRGAPTADATGLDPEAHALFDRLRALRRDIAARENLAAYMVFADRTLIEMARHEPRSLAEMKTLHGVGEVKLDRYGDAFLAALRDVD
ncbi:MAG: DNA helicase RecQ [Bauldia sp.]|uniref:DNA helicase RecQ n=1 Tax=Bauldia sp. TaxID=2575872 RepID=UPI001D5E4C63|nr:DNA helicase RecQ [Bauldia sp.]MCB1496481.1 DNA helicase RecQ [Bauldia sp.]